MPKRRPPVRPKSIDSNDSIIMRRTKKRMFIVDSDTDNSIVIEHDKQKKQACLKDTPLKIDNKVIKNRNVESAEYDDESEQDDEKSDVGTSNRASEGNVNESIDVDDIPEIKTSSEPHRKSVSRNNSFKNSDNFKHDGNENDDCDINDNGNKNDDDASESDVDGSDDEGPDEDLMVMSRATRMSIMGVIPKDDESDDSDYIQSDEVNKPQSNLPS